MENEEGSWRKRLRRTPLMRFMKAYPRLSAAAGVIVVIFFIALPGSAEDKMMVILRTLAIGFLIAFAFYCFRAFRQGK